MLMIFYFYWGPITKFIYFTSSALVAMIALLMLKRGVYGRRPRLRLAAFLFMFTAIVKVFLLDLRFAKQYLLCDAADGNLPGLPCTPEGMMRADFLGMLLCVIASFGLLNAYRDFVHEKKRERVPPEKVRLRLWANMALGGVLAMICWLAAPWLGFLTVGRVPQVFLDVPWTYFAAANLALLFQGFWLSESCAWTFEVGKKDRMRHLQSAWTPRDTLWMTVFLYLIALALSYVAHDILTAHNQVSP